MKERSAKKNSKYCFGVCSGSFNNDVHNNTFFQENDTQSPGLATIDGNAIRSLYHHDLYEKDDDETEEMNQRENALVSTGNQTKTNKNPIN